MAIVELAQQPGIGNRQSAIGNRQSGTVLDAGDTITIACGHGAIDVMDVQPAGKARMTAQAFANGRRVAIEDVLA